MNWNLVKASALVFRMKVFVVDNTVFAFLLLALACIACDAFSATDSNGRTELCNVSFFPS